jgi:hypothetical protein
MGYYTFQKNGRTFQVNTPADVTSEQAKAILDQQAATGSLVGLAPGETLSAETQAAQGLASAEANAAQNFKQSGKTLSQGISQLAGSISSGVKSVGSGLVKAGKAIGRGLSSAVSKVGSGLGTTVTKIAEVVATVPIGNGITAGNFATGTTALLGIGSMNQAQTTGVLAQASNNVNQPSTQVSNTKGVGKYGLTVAQLESAGYVRPGNAALVNENNTPVSILKSPAAWTGKDGVNSLDDLLANQKLQAKIQQTTMVQGLASLAAVGIVATGGTDAIVTASVALVAAKGIQEAAAYFKNKPIPNDPGGVKQAAADQTVRSSAYAVNYTEEKLPPVWKAEETPVPATATVNRSTVNAASARIVGNDKVPAPVYENVIPDVDLDYKAVGKKFTDERESIITKVNADLQAIKNSSLGKLERTEARERLSVQAALDLAELRTKVIDYWYKLLKLTRNNSSVKFEDKVFYDLAKELADDVKQLSIKVRELRDELARLRAA